MSTYYISTDGASQEIEADSLAEALQEFGEAPEHVKDVATFESWLIGVGGHGTIHEDGVPIAKVEA